MIDRCSSSRSGNGWEAVQTAGVRMGWEALVARGGADKQTLQMVPGPPVSVVTDGGRLRPWAQPWTKTSCALRDVCSLVTWERLALLPPPPPSHMHPGTTWSLSACHGLLLSRPQSPCGWCHCPISHQQLLQGHPCPVLSYRLRAAAFRVELCPPKTTSASDPQYL